MADTFLLTVEPFFAPDGKQYSGIWGTVTRFKGGLFDEHATGGESIDPPDSDTFYIHVGSMAGGVDLSPEYIYAMTPCPKEPITHKPTEVSVDITGTTRFTPAPLIYIAGIIESDFIIEDEEE